MKKQAMMFAAMMMMSMGAMAQKSNFQLKANVGDFCKDSLLVYKGRGVKMDTILVKNGKFTYTASLEKPERYFLITPEAYRTRVWQALNIMCVPNEKAVLNQEKDGNYDVNGSKYYQQYHEMDQMQSAISKDEAKNEKLLAFAAQHPDYECSAELIDELEDVKDMEKLISLLSDGVKNGRMKAYYQPILDRAKKRAEMEEKAKKVQASGVEAPDFTLNDIQGNPLSLSSLKGKYVVIDFWGSWCIWCIKGMPKMKEYYEKYKGKFEILGVDCNDTEAKWKAAVEKHQLPWLHVYNPKTSDVLSKYAIQGFPTKIIVGPDGKIVKTIVGEDPAFYTLLDELLK